MATRRVRRKVRRGRKTKRVRRSGRGRKTKRVRRSGRGGVSQADMFSVLLELKDLQKSVRENINGFVTAEIENINGFVTNEMRRINRPIIKALAKFDVNAKDIAPVYRQRFNQLRRTDAPRMST